MMKWGVWGVFIVALAAYGCDTANGGPIGDGGTGGDAGGGGMAGGGGAAGGGGMAGGGGAAGGGGMAGGGGVGGATPTKTSCLDWRNDGADVDGTYLIDVGGSNLIVYCNMTADGGGWTQLYDQDVALGFLPAADWAAGVNTTPPNMGQYSILNLIDNFEGTLGFEFFIDWPNDGTDFVRWRQSENPFDDDDDDPGLVGSSVVQSPTNQLGCTTFGGLGVESGGRAALAGSTNQCWWWAVGASQQYGAGIPGYSSSDASGLVATRTRLWVR